MILPNRIAAKSDYPTTDGKPTAETELHGLLMFALIDTLRLWYAQDDWVYVWGNLLMYYERGSRRRHVAPDVFVVKGVPKHRRDNYLIWEEGRAPDLVIELTSSSTRHADTKRKFLLYQNTLRVREYYLFDPHGDYLTPTLQGYRLYRGQYVALKPVAGRLPSKVLGLYLESRGDDLKLYDPATGLILPTPVEHERIRAEQAEARAAEEKARADQTEAELQRALRELERFRRQNGREA
jgi:Uma2 family endonuclease